MNSKIILLVIFYLIVTIAGSSAKSVADSKQANSVSTHNDTVRIQNPMSVKYLKANLRKSYPRLVLTPAIEKNLKKKIATDAVVKNYYQAVKLNAQQIQKEPLLTRQVEGRRLLAVSREMLYRMTVLSMVYRIEKDPIVLKRIDDEVK